MSVLGLGLGAAVACGGRSNQSSSSRSAAGAGLGGESSSGKAGAPSGMGGMPAAAGSVAAAAGIAGTTAGTGGSWPECRPGSPASCDGLDLLECSSEGSFVLTPCDEHEECSLAGGAHCEPRDEAALGTLENDFGFAWRDAFMLLPCYEVSGHACFTTPGGPLACPNQDAPDWKDRGLVLSETFAIGGEGGKLYNAHLVVNGIVSGKYYEGGVRDRGTEFADANDPQGGDAFYRGGRPIESSYDVWEIIVRREDGEVFAHYYLNSYPSNSGFESHQTLPLGFEKDIEVPGGGSIEYRLHDSNCYTVKNCLFGDFGVCQRGGSLPNEPDLILPETWHGEPLASLDVVGNGQQPFHAQLVHLRVTKITYVGEDPG